MAEPIAEQIAAKVKTRLERITTGNGYNLTADPQRVTRLAGYEPGHFAIEISQGTAEPNDELSCPGNPPAQAYDMPFELKATIRSSESDTVATDTFRNRFWADMVKVLGQDTAWHTWDGLAVNSVVGPAEPYASDDGEPGVRLVILVTFLIDENNPYNLRT